MRNMVQVCSSNASICHGICTKCDQDAFITNEHDVDDDVTRRTNALLDSSRHFEEEDSRSPEEIAKAVARRHRDRAAPYTGDMNEIPQRLLMPSVHDASLWQVRVKVCFYLGFFLRFVLYTICSLAVNATSYLV